jgi:hypothetical protein
MPGCWPPRSSRCADEALSERLQDWRAAQSAAVAEVPQKADAALLAPPSAFWAAASLAG